MKLNILVIIGLLSMASCKDEPEEMTPINHDLTPYEMHTGDFPPPYIAEDNKLTVQGVQLGRMLFYEKKLSRDGSMACASCHRQEHAFSDTNRLSIGVEDLPGKRQAMAVINMAWNTNEFFWDGRAHLLRDQSILPIQDELEMNETLENVVSKLSVEQTYLDQFKRAFGSTEITSLKISLALEQFMNSIVSVDSKYDQFLRGDVSLTASEERGRVLFFAEYNEFFPTTSGADCAHCHSPSNFSNNEYMNNGLNDVFTDIGREEVTMNPADKGKMKVTSLRNIELTTPYMHDGSFTTLEEVVDHYNSGLKASPTLDPALANTMNTGLMLDTQEKEDLVAFLKTFTDQTFLNNSDYTNPF
ncbi:MAG: cytochrome c peroxidase [Salibacteraceae bacterium]|jgi:cytochrome c peroxidase